MSFYTINEDFDPGWLKQNWRIRGLMVERVILISSRMFVIFLIIFCFLRLRYVANFFFYFPLIEISRHPYAGPTSPRLKTTCLRETNENINCEQGYKPVSTLTGFIENCMERKQKQNLLF